MKNKITFQHGENSRISNVILKTLKGDELFKVSKINVPPHLRKHEEHVYETEISLRDLTEPLRLNTIRDEIIAIIPDTFPVNYMFRFTDAFSPPPFNYKLEFALYDRLEGETLHCYTKVKELHKKSAKIDRHTIKTD